MEKFKSKLNALNLIQFGPAEINENVKIGSGGFSKVVSGNYKSMQLVVKKLKFLDEVEFLKEIRNVKAFKHRYVPSLYGLYVDKKKKQLGLVSEIVKGETLDKVNEVCELSLATKRIGNAGFIQKMIHMIDLATVLNYFHSHYFIHRDLKPNNVMVDTDSLEVKLLDFGISKMSDKTKTTTVMKGTVLYMAPENFRIPTDIDYDDEEGEIANFSKKIEITNKIDIWAYGCILCEIFSNKKPWEEVCKTDNEIVSNLFMGKKFHIPHSIERLSHSLKQLIEMCTDSEPGVRPNIRFIKYYLLRILHDHIKENGLTEVLNHGQRRKTALLTRITEYMNELKYEYSLETPHSDFTDAVRLYDKNRKAKEEAEKIEEEEHKLIGEHESEYNNYNYDYDDVREVMEEEEMPKQKVTNYAYAISKMDLKVTEENSEGEEAVSHTNRKVEVVKEEKERVNRVSHQNYPPLIDTTLERKVKMNISKPASSIVFNSIKSKKSAQNLINSAVARTEKLMKAVNTNKIQTLKLDTKSLKSVVSPAVKKENSAKKKSNSKSALNESRVTNSGLRKSSELARKLRNSPYGDSFQNQMMYLNK